MLFEIKEDTKFDFLNDWTKRKLRNVELIDFRSALLIHLKKRLKESYYNLVVKSHVLEAKNLCENYKFNIGDFMMLKEGTRTYNTVVDLKMRKIVELYLEANELKTVWYDNVSANKRGENYKLLLNE